MRCAPVLGHPSVFRGFRARERLHAGYGMLTSGVSTAWQGNASRTATEMHFEEADAAEAVGLAATRSSPLRGWHQPRRQSQSSPLAPSRAVLVVSSVLGLGCLQVLPDEDYIASMVDFFQTSAALT